MIYSSKWVSRYRKELTIMVQALREIVTVEEGGVVRLKSGQLSPGDRVELIVLLDRNISTLPPNPDAKTTWRQFAGSITTGNPRSADNAQIDVDLNRSANHP